MEHEEKVFSGSGLAIFIIIIGGVTTLFIPSLMDHKRMIAEICAGLCMLTLISFAVFMASQRMK